MNRLPPVPGEWLDRSHTLRFRFEGRDYEGFAGDSVSSALWASGRKVLGRSFKYHRPRGLLSLANHDVNALMQAGAQVNLRADITPLEDGMSLAAVNTFGGADGDRARLLGAFSRFLPVGFYYKAFHGKRLFPLWERMFRRLTGLGRLDLSAPRMRTPKRYDFCDVLVIGAGPSGLAAALAAAERGASVVVADEQPHPGGSGHFQLGAEHARRARVDVLLDAVLAHPCIRLQGATVAAGYYADHWVPLVDRHRLTKMRARTVVVATGAFEQPAVFRNNDLPGVMLASAAQRLIYRYAVRPCERAVVLAANDDAYRAALDLLAHGVAVVAVADLRAAPHGPLVDAVCAAGVEVLTAHCVFEAVPGDGGKAVAGARLAPFSAEGEARPEAARNLACDGILMGVGWAPAANLLYQAGARMRFDDALQQFVPEVLPDGVFACGKVNGVFDLAARLLDGTRAGEQAAAHCGLGAASTLAVAAESGCPSHPWPIVPHPGGRNFVDFDEDLQFKDFVHAVQEGFDNIELLKRFSTNGMGPSQGKHSNMNGLRILARLTGQSPQQVGTTTARPFFHPVPMSHLAGRGFTPERRTPMHARHVGHGAVWMAAGQWQRPAYYQAMDEALGDAGDGAAAEVRTPSPRTWIEAEVAAVRSGVGLIDVGTLGKLEVIGPQAAEFLERIYVSRYAGLKVGMTRYAAMCDESGVLIDDGVVARLADDHFYFTTTTANAAPLYRELSRLNTMWRLDCGIVNLTAACAAVNLAGPKARAVLAQLTELDLSGAAFPYLAVREGEVAGIPARLMRVGFVGEWGYEIHVPAGFGLALWDALLHAGASHGIRPFGVEAQRILRLEKGHLIIGQDSDGLTTPLEAALDWAVKMDKPFFVGQRSLQAIGRRPPRQVLVGFTLDGGRDDPAPQECHLVIHHGEIGGRVTSVAWSPTLSRHIGLAYVPPELATADTPLDIRLSDGRMVRATVTPTPFHDPLNLAQMESA
ncbi:MAG: FAD-dependent oxidoreductase [Rhodocyclaceae bacterium]